MNKRELVKEIANIFIDKGWAISFSKGSGRYNDLSGGDLTVITSDETVANLCIIVRNRQKS